MWTPTVRFAVTTLATAIACVLAYQAGESLRTLFDST